MEFYNVLIQIRLTTSKTKRDIYYSKFNIQVASRVAEQLTAFLPLGGYAHTRIKKYKKTQKDLASQEMRKHQENPKFGWRHSPAPSPPQKSNPGSSSHKTRKSRYQTPLPPPSHTGPPSHPKYPAQDCRPVQ